MIGLMAMAALAIWILMVIYLCKRIPHWLGIRRFAKAAQFLLFPILFMLPLADEFIGRLQFNELCGREAVVNLSPKWVEVKKAKEFYKPRVKLLGYLDGYLLRIQELNIEYLDIDNNQYFLSYKSFYHHGGLLMDRVGLGLGRIYSCRPKDLDEITKQIHLYELLKQGK